MGPHQQITEPESPESWHHMPLKDITIQTLWRTAREQCELVSLGLLGCRLRLWVKGVLVVDEEVFDGAEAMRRAAELRVEWPRLVE